MWHAKDMQKKRLCEDNTKDSETFRNFDKTLKIHVAMFCSHLHFGVLVRVNRIHHQLVATSFPSKCSTIILEHVVCWYIHLSFLHGRFALSRSSVSSVILKLNVLLSVSTPCTTLHLRNFSALSAMEISSVIFDGSVSLLCFRNSFLILCLPASKARVSSLKTFSRVL